MYNCQRKPTETGNTMSDVALIPKENALEVFTAASGLDPYLAKIRAEIDSFTPDVSSRKGREAIASIAHSVARSKTALDTIGKDLVAELKDVPKKIDAERKRMRDLLDAWKEEVRRPLTEWEEREQARVDRIQAQVSRLGDADVTDMPASAIKQSIDNLEAHVIDAHYEEFEPEAHRVKAASLAILREALAKREQYEAEQAELGRLRAEAAERAARDERDRIIREAAERATREAEAKAQADRGAAAKREADAKAETERRELELKLQAERAEREKLEAKQRAEQAERDAIEQKAAAERARIAAEQQAAQDKLDAERRQAEAVARAEAAERQRQADEQARIERETAEREADTKHKAAINRAALEAFVAHGMTPECAKQAVTLIAKRAIPNVNISY